MELGYSLLSWRERIETHSPSCRRSARAVTPSLAGGRGLKRAISEHQRKNERYSLLSWRERIETTWHEYRYPAACVTPSLAGGRGLKRWASGSNSIGRKVTPSLAGGRGLKHCNHITLCKDCRYSLLSWRERIETIKRPSTPDSVPVTPSLAGGRGLKQPDAGPQWQTSGVTPSLAGGRGLKLRFPNRKFPPKAVTPSLAGGRGLKLEDNLTPCIIPVLLPP